ncbi:MAG: haloacid dehalogenase, partial [Acidobacteria bacterium]|nr:haloacid dehalogenase [Acidobacteriota bacterium]
LARSDVLHTAQSLHHDHVPAKRLGLANAWIDRQRLSAGGSWGATARVDPMPSTDFVFFSMGEMAEAVSATL